MSTRDVDVCIDGSDGSTIVVGHLFLTRRRGTKESATFRYDDEWLQRAGSYAIDPQLPLAAGPFHTGPDQRLFRALADSSPDRWGIELARRYERKHADDRDHTPRSFGEGDLLLEVRDALRQGALRLRNPGAGTFLAPEDGRVPILMDLARLLSASTNLERDVESEEELRLLLEAGSSLGGARPKAHVQDRGRAYIAKFPRVQSDNWSVIIWEKIALELAAASGIRVAGSRLEQVADRRVLLVERFDREDGRRIGYISALTMLEARDGERHSYLKLAEALEIESSQASEDLQELWRRVAFSILISNTDDHLRNHGFLRSGPGWTLSPAFDINPNPDHAGLLSTAVETSADRSADIEQLVGVAEYFRVRDPRAALQPILEATDRWRDIATRLGVAPELDRLAPAFEHPQREAARRIVDGSTTGSAGRRR